MQYLVIPSRICGTWWKDKTIEVNIKTDALI